MKVLILGAKGMAGHTISVYFKENGYDVIAFSREEVSFANTIIGDATDFHFLNEVLTREKFDVVINCIGILNSYAENNKHNAVLLNSYLPHYLTGITKNMNTKIIHMSTDCVFSGKSGNYTEKSVRDGETFYDRSKALGEVENNKDLTFRNSIIGPDIKESGIGLFNWFMKQNSNINGYTKAIWTGVTTLTLAKAMEEAIKQDLTGIYNLVNNQVISKYDLLKLFNKHFKNNELTINESSDLVLDKSLINTREDFDFNVPSYEEMVLEMKEWVVNHRELYPHYLVD